MPKKTNPGAVGAAAGVDDAQSERTARKDHSKGASLWKASKPPATRVRRDGRESDESDTPITEDAVAIEFARRHSRTSRYVPDDRREWKIFSDGRWASDKLGVVNQRIRTLARKMADEANDRRSGARKTAGRASFVAGAEQLARTDPTLACHASDFDKDTLVLGTPAGLVDLRTGNLRTATPEDMISKVTLVAPAARAECPLWKSFLEDAAGGDAGLIRFLQQWAGYCLTGETIEHALVFICGPGGNGKSVFQSVLRQILGDYAETAAMETFTVSKFERHSTELATLRGARLVTVSETEVGKSLAEARIKQLTGGDRVTARQMYKNNSTYTPQLKLMIVGNHDPEVRSVDDAVRRRLIIVPFAHRPKQPDKELLTKLTAEYPAILRWMIDGCLDWQKYGLQRPSVVAKATSQYFESQDLVGQWLAEDCIVAPGNTTKWEKFSALFQAWKAFSFTVGEDPGSGKAFSGLLRQRGLEAAKGAGGTRIIRFVTLNKGPNKTGGTPR